jgi:hypothetical protein
MNNNNEQGSTGVPQERAAVQPVGIVTTWNKGGSGEHNAIEPYDKYQRDERGYSLAAALPEGTLIYTSTPVVAASQPTPSKEGEQEALRAKLEGKTATCWSCQAPYTERDRAEADGHCPHCGVEIELDDEDTTPTPSDSASVDTADALRDAVAEGLGGLYWCGRVWSAWGVGTMSQDDFTPADEDEDCINNVLDAVKPIIESLIAAHVAGVRKDADTAAAHDVFAERQRQKEVEGWNTNHDDGHDCGEMASAAACYALHTEPVGNVGDYLRFWPWDSQWWKPRDRRHNLVRAGALILAEIERLDRAAMAAHSPATSSKES